MNPVLAFMMAVAILYTITGCQKDPQEVQKQGEFRIEKLFTHEGCTLYRFYDDRQVYYSDCRGQTQTTRSCGKGCTTTDIVPTEK